MDAQRPDPTRTDSDFEAMWSSDGATRSFAPSAVTGLPTDLPFLFAAGQRFGPYQIVRPLGKGGMGQVYEAEEIESGRRVAVKILSRGIGDEEERARFIQEGQLAASLSHPNCVYVFGTSEVQGFPVIAMELAPAGTLKDLLVPGTPMPMAKAVDAILQVIAGLEAAAAIGILHRDIKPSNCFVDRDGRVLVGDFGLSIATLGRAEKTAEIAGTIMGTPGFASPEQLHGEALDVRSDIYSVGATIYYLLTGKAPFDDPDIRTMITKVATQPAPSVALDRPDLPGRLNVVVARCLAKKPGDRYASYAALAAALEPFRSADLTPAPLPRRFFAGFLDTFAPAILIMPWNMIVGSFVDARNSTDLLLTQLPSIVIMLAYYAVFEGRFGCAAGKAVLNLRVIDDAQTAPGMRRALMRAVILFMPAQIVNLTLGFVVLPEAGSSPAGSGSLVAPILAAVSVAFSAAVLAVMFSTARRRNGFAGLHDLATKTRVVVRPRAVEARKAAPRSARADHGLSAARERLGPYAVADGVKGRIVESPAIVDAYDDRLRRGVWLELLPAGTPPLPASRRDLGRPARSRWLAGRRAGDECWDAYESVEGRPFLDAAAVPQPWSRVRHWLSDLVEEVAAGTKDGSLPPLSVDRIWIGADDRARLLDFVPPNLPSSVLRPPSPDLRPPSSDLPAAQQFLYGIAAGALTGAHPDAARDRAIATPLPLGARALLAALRGGSIASADDVRAHAELQLRTPASMPMKRRATQMAVCAVVPIVFTISAVGAVHLLRRSQTADPEAYALKTCAGHLVGLDRLGLRMTVKQREDHRLVEIYIAEHLQEAAEESAAVARSFPVMNRIQGEHEVTQRAIARHPARSRADVEKADKVVADLLKREATGLAGFGTPLAQLTLAVFMITFGTAFVGALALVGSLVARGGFLFRPFGAALVRRDGSLAGRPRAFLRALITWSPIALVCFLILKGPSPQHADLALTALNTGILLLFVGCAVWALLHPSRGLQDRYAGTWMVPR
jgi:serine/threonine protein kinase